MRSFAIYCSDGASRVLKFYAAELNRAKYFPSRVIYDGDRVDVISNLRSFFKDNLVVISSSNLTIEDRKRIHSYTSQFIHNVMREEGIEYLLCFGNKILKKELIVAYNNKLINFHPSLLPSFPGLRSIDQALQAGVTILGNTAHCIDAGIDTGKIILQTAMLRDEFEEYEDVLELQLPMIKLVLRDILGYDVSDETLLAEIKHRTKQFLMSPTAK